MSIEHPDEGCGRLLQTVDEVLALTDAAGRDACADLAQEFWMVRFGKFIIDEPA
jgi:hypothetical protein